MNIDTNEKMEAIATKAGGTCKELICENATEIIDAIAKAAQQAQDKREETGEDQALKVSLRYTIKLDLVADEQTGTLAWTVAHKAEKVERLPDPDAPELALEEE